MKALHRYTVWILWCGGLIAWGVFITLVVTQTVEPVLLNASDTCTTNQQSDKNPSITLMGDPKQEVQKQFSETSPPAQKALRGTTGKHPQAKKIKSNECINVNEACAEELTRLPGIGPVLASRIIDFRQQYGKFRTVVDLIRVKGIGKKKLAKMTANVCL
ncbi:MAG: ComEA family DNA-binding protein [Chitinivibrionales bacterium]|nr:ComEA family DNA-binding protein [Chitinivibrionales bacterium]